MTGSTEPTNRGIDALLPADIARKAETVGDQKTRRDILSLLALAVLAGAFIALGAMFATTVLAGAMVESKRVLIEAAACSPSNHVQASRRRLSALGSCPL
jgi:hypothetical protein